MNKFQWTNETLLYKNISFILFLKRAHSLLLIWEIDGGTYTPWGDFFLSHIFFWEPGVPMLAHPCKPYRQRSKHLCSAACPLLDSQFSASLNLTAWFSSRGLLPLTHLLDLTALTRCLQIKMWQLVKAHGVTSNEQKIHVICYITTFSLFMIFKFHKWFYNILYNQLHVLDIY